MPPRQKNQNQAPAPVEPPVEPPAAPPVEPPAEIQPPVEAPEPVEPAPVVEADAPALGSAAERRADYLRALGEELEACKRAGKKERVAAIEAEIKRVKSGPKGRSQAPADEA